MPPDLPLAIQISLVGMTVIFAAIILLWGLMALLVRFTPERVEPDAPADRRATLRERTQAVLAADAAPRAALRPRAAAAAVAALLAGRRTGPASAPPPPTATVSPWQAAMRASRLRQRGPTR